MKKSEITYHHDRGSRPAINVKVRTWPLLTEEIVAEVRRENGTDARFTLEWIDQHVSEDDQGEWFWSAIESCRDMLQTDIEEIFGPGVEAEYEGRSGGWLVLHGIEEDTYCWDAVMLAKWGKLRRYAGEQVENVPNELAILIAINVFDPWLEKDNKRRRDAAIEVEATVAGDFPADLMEVL